MIGGEGRGGMDGPVQYNFRVRETLSTCGYRIMRSRGIGGILDRLCFVPNCIVLNLSYSYVLRSPPRLGVE